MTTITIKIGLGGGCHGCTLDLFKSLKGMRKVNRFMQHFDWQKMAKPGAVQFYN